MIDNAALYDAEEKRLARAEASRVHCDECGEAIWDDFAYRIGDDLICERCMEEKKEWIDDF